MSTENLRVGFIGLGKMGAGMCASIQKAGFPLTVYNRSSAKMQRFVDAGATAASSAREVAENSDVVFTSLMDDASVLDNVTGENGILAGLKPGGVHVCVTTISPKASQNLEALHQEKDTGYVACPVGGRPDAAEAGQLFAFTAGAAEAVEKAKPAIDSYSAQFVPLGPNVATANAMKVVTNYMGLTQLNMMSEMFTFAEKSGLPGEMVEMMLGQMYGAGPMKDYAKTIKERNFESSGFDMTGGLKDALIFEQAFTDVGVKSTAIKGAKDKFTTGIANGMGGRDWAALVEACRLEAGLDTIADK